MRFYPVFLDIAGRPAVVIGGGDVALQKVKGLLDAGAEVTVVSPQLHPDLKPLASEGRLRHIEREYEPGDLEGYLLAFVATDDRSINAAVAAEGKERRVLVNAVDDTPNCDFIMPAIAKRGGLIVAVSTSGGSPAMARKMREELEAFLTEDYALMLDLAAEVRRELLEKKVMITPDVWNAALDADVKRLLAEGRREEAKDRLLRRLLEPAAER
jgi:precorrin-2 dehydrogenase/sirohydrochlorin ferrochelatase